MQTNTVVFEAEYYKFIAKLKTGEKLKHWTLNGKPKTSKTSNTWEYGIDKNDVDSNNNTITIGWEKE
ncbi:MAG: hypothetical protein ACTTKH_01200 [Treponema sp.]